MKLFTTRSTIVSLTAGALVAAAWRFIGVSWGLGVLNGVAVATIILVLRQAYGLGRLGGRRLPGIRPWFGVHNLGMVVVMGSSGSVRFFLELDIASEFAVSMLILSIGFAAYGAGDVVATLDHRDSAPPQAEAGGDAVPPSDPEMAYDGAGSQPPSSP